MHSDLEGNDAFVWQTRCLTSQEAGVLVVVMIVIFDIADFFEDFDLLILFSPFTLAKFRTAIDHFTFIFII